MVVVFGVVEGSFHWVGGKPLLLVVSKVEMVKVLPRCALYLRQFGCDLLLYLHFPSISRISLTLDANGFFLLEPPQPPKRRRSRREGGEE